MKKELNKRIHINKNAGDPAKNIDIFNHSMGSSISEKKLNTSIKDRKLNEASNSESLANFSSLVADIILKNHKEDTYIEYDDFTEELYNAIEKVFNENQEFNDLKPEDEDAYDEFEDDVEVAVSVELNSNGWEQNLSSGDFYILQKFTVPFTASLAGDVTLYAPDKYKAYELANNIGLYLIEYANDTFELSANEDTGEIDTDMKVTFIDSNIDVEFNEYDTYKVEDED